MRTTQTLIVPCMALASLLPQAWAQNPDSLLKLAGGQVQYSLGLRGILVGKTQHQWRREGERYVLESRTDPVGLAALIKPGRIIQTSEGRVTAAGLQPERFRVSRDGGKSLSESAQFDWAKLQLTWGETGQPQQSPLSEGSQDVISMIWQLAHSAPAGASELDVTTGKGVAHHRIERLDDEKVSTALGEMISRHYRTAAAPGERSTEVWLAPDYRMLPVRVRFVEKNGDAADLVLEAVDFGPFKKTGGGR